MRWSSYLGVLTSRSQLRASTNKIDKGMHMADRIYCLGVAKYHLVTSVREEIRSFLEGFHSVIPYRIVSIFDQDELDFLLEGTQEIDLADWKENSIYRGDFTNKHKVVKWFWEILETFSQ